MKKLRKMMYAMLLMLSLSILVWGVSPFHPAQAQIANGYWSRPNTSIEQLHRDYKECKGQDKCLEAKGYKWIIEEPQPGYWSRPNTSIEQLHRDYKECKGQDKCLEAKGYKCIRE
jgi:hypothetical protein